MRIECIEALILCNREIEFTYHGSRYSITYYNDNREYYISVAGPGPTIIDVKNASDVFKIKIGNLTLDKVFAQLPDSAFDIF